MHPERVFRYIKEAFTPYPLPKLPKQPTSKLSRAEQAQYQRDLRAAREKQAQFQHQRRVVIGGGAVVLGAAVAAPIVVPAIVDAWQRGITPPWQPDSQGGVVEPDEYSGNNEETRSLLSKWQREVGSDVNKLETYAPKVVNLAVAYFSTQMGEMFPDRQVQYQKENFNGEIQILSPQDYRKEASRCSPVGNDPASTDPLTGRIAISPRTLYQGASNKGAVVETLFLVGVHELIHQSAELVRSGEGFYTQALREPISFRRGLQAFSPDTNPSVAGKDCYRRWWYEAEEMVVEHAATKLCERVGVRNLETGYRPWINDYENQVVNPKYHGKFSDLLRYQQSSDLDGFLAAIGRSFASDYNIPPEVRNNMPLEMQAAIGSQVMVQLADAKKLR